MDDLTDPSLAIVCRLCEAGIGQYCKKRGRRKYMHMTRYVDWRKYELDRRRRVREAYLAEWILTHGHIFKE